MPQAPAKAARTVFSNGKLTSTTANKEFGYTVFIALALELQAVSRDGGAPTLHGGLVTRVGTNSPLHIISGSYAQVLYAILDDIVAAAEERKLSEVRTHDLSKAIKTVLYTLVRFRCCGHRISADVDLGFNVFACFIESNRR